MIPDIISLTACIHYKNSIKIKIEHENHLFTLTKKGWKVGFPTNFWPWSKNLDNSDILLCSAMVDGDIQCDSDRRHGFLVEINALC